MKRCFRCLAEKPLEAFYKHAQMSDGRLNKCIDCTKADVAQNRLKKIEHYRAFDRARNSNPERVAARRAYTKTPEGRLAHARANEKWLVSNAVRRQASSAVNNAIRAGKLQRQPCFICGEKAHAHHPDYSRPLDVTWLCAAHHKAAHAIAANDSVVRDDRSTRHY